MKYLHNYKNIPEHNMNGFENYLIHGIEPGSFLMAVLTNDLYGAVFKADSANLIHIPHIVSFLHTVPSICFGNIENVRRWMNDADGIRSEYVTRLRQQRISDIIETE